MAPRLKVVQTQIPSGAIAGFRSLARQPVLESLVAPKFAEAFKGWLTMVAKATAIDMPKRSGRSAAEVSVSARVTGGTRTLDNIRGYFLVGSSIAANEYGADVYPVNAKKLAIPLPAALRPDGSPKRKGPLSWRSSGSFVYKSAKTGQLYIAIRGTSQGGKIVLLYLLVDHARIKQRRYLRNAYDRLQPALYVMFYSILQEQIELVYRSFAEFESKGKTITYKPNNSPPSPTTWTGPLMPRYRNK